MEQQIGDLPLTVMGLEKMRPDLGLSKEAIKKIVQRSKASDPKQLLMQLPDLVRSTTQLATFKAGAMSIVVSSNHLHTPSRHPLLILKLVNTGS